MYNIKYVCIKYSNIFIVYSIAKERDQKERNAPLKALIHQILIINMVNNNIYLSIIRTSVRS